MPGRDALRIGHLSTAYHTSLVLIGKEELLRDAGISASWTLFPSGPEIVAAFSRHEIDVGYLGLPPAMIGIAGGLPIRCVAGGHVEGTVMIGPPGAKSFSETGCSMRGTLEQFKQRAIGSPPKGSIHDIIIRHYLNISGLADDVAVRNYAWADLIPDAISSGEVSAAVGTPALAALAFRMVGFKTVIPPHALWPYNPSYGILVKRQLIEESPDLIEKFLRLHEDACNFIREYPLQAADLVANVIEFVDRGFVLDAFRISPKYCASLPERYLKSTMDLASHMYEMKYLPTILSADEVFDLKLISKIHKGPSHYENPSRLV